VTIAKLPAATPILKGNPRSLVFHHDGAILETLSNPFCEVAGLSEVAQRCDNQEFLPAAASY
jgi:hypothetical protein